MSSWFVFPDSEIYYDFICRSESFILYFHAVYSLQYAEYEKVVIEDRVEKEKARRQAEQEAHEIKSAIQVVDLYIIINLLMK